MTGRIVPVLHGGRATRTPTWVLAGDRGVGATLGEPTAHLWDEVVGHYIWFAGVALVLAALAVVMTDRPRGGAFAHALALAVGLTWATNAIGGGTVVFSLVIAIAAVAFGWQHRRSLTGVLRVGFAPAVVVLLGELLLR